MPDPRRWAALFEPLAAIGRNPSTGGLNRFAWTDEDAAARRWFEIEAARRGLEIEVDGNGNQWAWWGEPAAGAIATGSHLDSVPEGGAYDGALGVAAGFLAIDHLRERGFRPSLPIALLAFADEEGARFGIPTFGSRLMTGALDLSVLDRADHDAITLGEAAAAAGVRPTGAEPERVRRLNAFVEVHVEQGRGLVDLGLPLAVATEIWPHGRWRVDLAGEADHAGTARLDDRRDPALALATLITSARETASRLGSVATVGRVEVSPNGTNVVPGAITAWLDARAPNDQVLDELVQSVGAETEIAAASARVHMSAECESRSSAVDFDHDLRGRIQRVLAKTGKTAALPTAAGHDAGVLAAHLPTAMIFVRNPTGASHTPAEAATDEDCALACEALADVLADLTA